MSDSKKDNNKEKEDNNKNESGNGNEKTSVRDIIIKEVTKDENGNIIEEESDEDEVNFEEKDEEEEPSSDMIIEEDTNDEETKRFNKIQYERKKALEDLRKEQNSKINKEMEVSKKERINYLIQQTDIFRHFIKNSMKRDKEKNKKTKRESKGDDEEEEIEEQGLLSPTSEPQQQPVRLTVSPSFIQNGTLREYQIEGLNWLINLHDRGINGILADEMGLGKTLQTISLLGYLKHVRKVNGPHLVICPKSTLANWCKEFEKWCPTLRIFKFHGQKQEREAQREKIIAGAFDVLVTTYELSYIEKNVLKKFSWKYLVIDEAHRIKNEKSVLSKVVRLFTSHYRLLITGTPLQNNLHELWSLLNFLLPYVFSSSEDFDKWFNIEQCNKEEVMEKLHKVLRPFLLRRLKSEVETSLPPKHETKLFVKLSKMQREWYINIITKNIDVINGSKESRVRLLNILMQLRKCCNHPYLFEGAEPLPYENGEHIIQNSGKLSLLDLLLKRLFQRGSRVLIFSQMTRMLDILEDYMIYRAYQYCRIDGQTSGDDRDEAIDQFNQPGSETFVFLLSTRAGGLGINLATADTVILYDSDWNPQVDLQAQDRAHRIGQKKQVNVYRLITEKTVEEVIVERAEAKLYLDALVIQQGRLTGDSSLTKNDISNIIKFGADDIYKAESDVITEGEIDVILSKGEERTKEIQEKFQDRANSLAKLSLNTSDVNIYEYMGVNYKNETKIKGKQFLELPQRGRNRLNTNMNDDQYYREVFGKAAPKAKAKTRPPKQPILYDFQFFPEQLHKLFEKETQNWKNKMEEKEKNLQDALSKDPSENKEKEKEKEELNVYLTEVEIAEKEKLLKKGFGNWTKKEYFAFLRGCEQFGRTEFASISNEIGTKTADEVKKYSAVFWKKISTLPDHQKISTNIEKGENRIKKRQDMIDYLAKKVGQYKDPFTQLTIHYGNSKGKQYSTDEDRFLICMTHKVGYGNWDALKAEVRNQWKFRFNWMFKSKSALELSRRVDTLIRLIEKELAQKPNNNNNNNNNNKNIAKNNAKANNNAKPNNGAKGSRKNTNAKQNNNNNNNNNNKTKVSGKKRAAENDLNPKKKAAKK